MKKKIVNEDKTTLVGKLIKKVKDFFYDLSVRVEESKRQKGKVKKASVATRKRSRRIFYYSLIIVPLIHYLIFYVGVNFNSILLSFKEYVMVDDIMVMRWRGFENYAEFFTKFKEGTILKQMLSNSLLYYFIGLLVGLPLALFFSFYIYKKYFFSEFFRVVLFLPSIVSSVVTVFMYKYMVDIGIVEIVFKVTGEKIMPPMAEPEYRIYTVIFYNVIMSFGTNILMYSSAMTRIPVSVVEYAALDGVKPFREFLTMTIPLIFGTISTFIIVGVSSIFTNQAGLYIMFSTSADTDVATLGYHLFILTALGATEANFPQAAAIGIIFTLCTVPLVMFLRWGLGKIDPNVQY